MIYADFNGSSPLHPEVIKYLGTRLESGPYANPNSIHSIGRKMLFGLEKCRATSAKILGAKPKQVIYNSGSSEGITHVFHSVLDNSLKKTIITSGIEHSAIYSACDYYASKGFEVIKVNTHENGVIDLVDLEKLIQKHKEDLALVTIMAANNETGVIQPYKEIGSLCQSVDAPYFSDTTQFIGKTAFNFAESNMDYAVLSGHKIGAIIGSGLLLAKTPEKVKPLIFGGGQESGKRGGTQNYIGAETIAVALEDFNKNISKLDELVAIRENFEKNIKKDFPSVVILGEDAPRLATTTLISYPGIHGQAVQIELESNDIFVTTSSACSDNEPETSKVLKSMNVDDQVGRGVVRISLCLGACSEKYGDIEKALLAAYDKLQKISSF